MSAQSASIPLVSGYVTSPIASGAVVSFTFIGANRARRGREAGEVEEVADQGRGLVPPNPVMRCCT